MTLSLTNHHPCSAAASCATPPAFAALGPAFNAAAPIMDPSLKRHNATLGSPRVHAGSAHLSVRRSAPAFAHTEAGAALDAAPSGVPVRNAVTASWRVAEPTVPEPEPPPPARKSVHSSTTAAGPNEHTPHAAPVESVSVWEAPAFEAQFTDAGFGKPEAGWGSEKEGDGGSACRRGLRPRSPPVHPTDTRELVRWGGRTGRHDGERQGAGEKSACHFF